MSDSDVTYRGTVYPWQCDHMGHMNVMWYVGKFDEASWHVISSLGLTRARLERDGVGMAAVEQRIEYKRELHAGDIITIRSRMLEVKEKTIRFIHEMRHDETGELAAKTDIVGVYIDTALRKAGSLPSDVRERARLLMGRENVERTNFEAISKIADGAERFALRPATERLVSPTQPTAMFLGFCW